MPVLGVRIIVALTVELAERRRVAEGIPRRAAVLIGTDRPSNRGRGFAVAERDVIWCTGCWRGRHFPAIEAAVTACFSGS